jgi:hypothetical protein
MDQTTEQGQVTPTETSAVPAAESTAPQIKSVGRNVVLPSNALGRIKNEARERGKKEALSELDAQAKAAGYSSFAEALGTIKGLSAARPSNDQKPKQKAPRQENQERTEQRQTQGKRSDERVWNREKDKYSRLLEQERRARQDEARRRRDLQRQLDASQAKAELEKAAIQCGVKDVDYAVALLLRNLEGKDETALSAFDESKFFEGLRGSHPYLFGEAVKPATTGTAGGTPPPTPKPGQVAGATAQASNGAPDPMAKDEHGRVKMTPQQFNEMLRKRGLNPLVA